MICIILQSRLDSSRLPRKALLDLGGKPVIVRVMENLRRVPADAYILACDTDSVETFTPLAQEAGFTCIGGQKENVLERFCLVIGQTGAETVLRATGDNPYLFADAAEASLRRFAELQAGDKPAHYFTFSGLPHGSGIEVFSARRLLEAAVLTDSAYDREHVGPALYRHPDRFVCVNETAPDDWYYPEMRTTIDTPADYDRASLMSVYLGERGLTLPASTTAILEAWRYVSRPLVFVPSVIPGQGTGHFQRVCGLVSALRASWRCLLYLPEGSPFLFLVSDALKSLVVSVPPESAHLVILDSFRTSVEDMHSWRKRGPVVSLDDGGPGRNGADYLLDIIPGIPGALCPPNLCSPAFLPLPANRRTDPVLTVSRVLVLAGGENAAGLALPAARLIAETGCDVTVIDPSARGLTRIGGNLTVSEPVADLRETLFRYDLVVTHFGFTAFEALAAGCLVLLFSPGAYHYRLARANGFSAVPPGHFTAAAFKKILDRGISVPTLITPRSVHQNLSQTVSLLASRTARNCPFCGSSGPARVRSRSTDRTISVCPVCGMEYLSFLTAGSQTYSRSYFFDEYKAQYGKTYLEDFESIRKTGLARLSVLDRLVTRNFRHSLPEKQLLDIGCAFGPFLAAARDTGWIPYGTDISLDAVAYVRDVLQIPAVVSAFPAPDAENSLEGRRFTAITLWYVIEHFADLESVLEKIRTLLVPGGILAFSTPSVAGVSGRFNPESFYRNSPRDHFTLWDPRKVRRQLRRYGFTVQKTVSTGHHAERFPFLKGTKTDSLPFRLCTLASRLFSLGDTFEVYARKNGSLEDIG